MLSQCNTYTGACTAYYRGTARRGRHINRTPDLQVQSGLVWFSLVDSGSACIMVKVPFGFLDRRLATR